MGNKKMLHFFFSFYKWAAIMCQALLGAEDARVHENIVSALEELKF